ncbi:MAG: translocation/assembly module TamB domain-containing protein, partial [Candidatus Caldatribacteriota bacterium]|nr:translocation/assembly module TamB domain-containing protein [Candidatus Caldatribacteriota bacterium]
QIFKAEEVIVKYNLDILSALKQETALEIEGITLVKPQMTLVRDSKGNFDFMEKFNLNLIGLFPVKGVNVKEGNLDYIDYQTTKKDGLLTSVKQLNGYFYLAELPKVEFSCSATREEDDSPLSLEGYFFTEKMDYVLDFTFKDAEIAHFQYYLVEDEILKAKKGLFDSNLRLSNDLDGILGKVNWQGKISLKDVDLSSNFLDSLEINQVYGSAIFDSQEISIENLTAIYQNSPFSLQGDLTYVDKLRYDVKVKSDNFELSNLVEEAKKYLSLSADFRLEGSSNLEIEVSGLENNFQVNGKLSTKEGNIGGYDFLNLSTGFNYDSGGIYLKEIKAEVAEGLIKGTGGINLSKELPEYNFSFDFSHFDTQSDLLKPLLSNYLKNGLLSGKVDIKGTIAEEEETNLVAKIKVEDNELGDFWFQTEGIIRKDNSLDLKLKAEGINLERLAKSFNYKEIEGQASFIGTLSGSPDNLKIRGKVETENTKIAGLSFNNLEGKIEYQENKLKLEEFILKNESINIRGGGEIDYLKAEVEAENRIKVNIDLQLAETDLSILAGLYDSQLPFSGLTNGEVSIQGYWPEVIAKSNFKFTDFSLANYKAETGSALIVLKDEKVKIENLVMNSGKNKLYAQGEISLEEDLPSNLRINFLNQNVQVLLSNFIESDLLNKFRGQATGLMELKGNIESPDLYLSAIIEDAQLEGLPLNSIDLKIEKIGSVVRINRLTLKQQKGELIAGGWLNLDPDNENMDIDISANNIDLSQLSSLFNLKDEFDGLVSFEAKAEGDINSPRISFSTQIEKAKYADFYFDTLNIEALYDQKILKVKQFVLNKEGNRIIGKGTIPYKFTFADKGKNGSSLADLPLDFTLNMENTDLKFMKLFFKEDFEQLGGLTNVNLKLSGTLKEPLLNGSVTLADGQVEFYKSIPKIENLNVMLRLEDNLVKITDMDFQVDQFKIYTSGKFALKNLQPQDLDIDIWSDKQEILYQDIFKGQANFNAKITGLFDFPHIKGTATLSGGELNLEEKGKSSFNLKKILSELINIKG